MPSGQTYSGAELRTRDKAIEEKHLKETAILNAKIQRLRHAYDERSEEYFASVNHGDRIAGLLGFRSLHEVQTFIDVELSDEHIKYKDLAKRVDELKAELAIERRDTQAVKNDLIDVAEERDSLKAALAEQSAKLAGPSAEVLARELVDLQSRYNEVAERAARADAEIKDRMVKWRAFKQWMQSDDKQYAERKKKLNKAEKIRDRDAYHAERRRKLKETGLDLDEPSMELLAGPETPIQNKLLSTIPPMFSSSPAVMTSANATPANDAGTRLLSSPMAPTRTSLKFASPAQMTVNQPSSSSIAPIPQSKDVIDISETDDESQGSTVAKEIPVGSPEDGVIASTTAQRSLPAPHSTLPSRPSFPQFGVDNPRERRSSNPFAAAAARRVRPEDEDADEERPRKVRRFSSPVRTPLAVTGMNGVRTSRNGDNTGTNRDRENRQAPRDDAPMSTPANTSGSKQLTDYSAFKGRGRYGKAPVGNDTINASYAIDPARNDGVNFQYAAVVRGKEDRQRMDGGDCECCHDYYEAIGPMPSRLQPPLWRSPQKSPSRSHERKPCRNGNGGSGREDAIQSHKQAISRHRHNWAQGSTPPGYWNIGFPSTQEAQLINEKAAEMQQQKLRMVQREAENGGRYYKTR
ncbi:DNA repair protein endonuclease SAE2/CtIP C-terminus-domain-containing protein [Mycena galopus ATCC 62051]|nr:DNA repair protein endonuclease SAE2/CtIP C-terminus-domain-containing protein [Mycena galopus ATCC 62051]